MSGRNSKIVVLKKRRSQTIGGVISDHRETAEKYAPKKDEQNAFKEKIKNKYNFFFK